MARVQFGNIGNGDVVGPTSATDRAIAIFNLATGKVIQNSPVIINAAGSVNIPAGQNYYIGGVPIGSGAGDVVGPAGATDSNVALFDTATGKKIKNSSVQVSGSGINIPSGQKYFINGADVLVVGPASSVDHAIARYDSTTGKILLNSLAFVDDTGQVISPGFCTSVGANSLLIANCTIEATGTNPTVDLYLYSKGATGKIYLNNVLAYVDANGQVISPGFCTAVGANSLLISNCTIETTGTNPVVDLYLYSKGAGSKIYMNGVAYVAGGDVVGPASSTDHEIVRYSGITGKIIQGGTSATLNDSSEITCAGFRTAVGANSLLISNCTIESTGTNAVVDLYLYSKGATGKIYLNGAVYKKSRAGYAQSSGLGSVQVAHGMGTASISVVATVDSAFIDREAPLVIINSKDATYFYFDIVSGYAGFRLDSKWMNWIATEY